MGSVYAQNKVTYRKWMRAQIVSDYREMIKNGTAPKLAEMLALQQAPSLQTDTRWMTGEYNGRQFVDTPQMGENYHSMAKQAGVITDGAVYKHGLARFPGDPNAWVRSRADVLKICKERNLDCEGSVNHKSVDDGSPDPFDLPYEVSQDIVDDHILSAIEDNHDIQVDDIPAMREDLTKKLSGGNDLD